MMHLEGNFMPVLYMGRKVPKGKVHLLVFFLNIYKYSLLPECRYTPF